MKSRSILYTILKVAGLAVLALLLYYSFWIVLDGQYPEEWPFSWGVVAVDYVMCFAISLLVSLFYWRSVFKIQRERDRFKMKSLENQINPHFVFNNFSILSELIAEDPKRAQDFLLNLSKVYRYNLNNVEKTLVPIHDELLFLHQYEHILETRFSHSFCIDIDPQLEQMTGQIAPCSLQMLVENALKHNLHTEQQPLHIAITTDGRTIAVSNPKQPLPNQPASTNLGNQNLVERYSLLSHQAVHISDTDKYYRVILPVL